MDVIEDVLKRADTLCMEGRSEEALELLWNCDAPPSFEMMYMKGRCLWRLDRYADSEAAYREALRIAEEEAENARIAAGNMAVGAISFERANYVRAVEHLRRADEIYGGRMCVGLANTLNWLGQAYHMLDLYDLASGTFSRALEVASEIDHVPIQALVWSNTGLMQMSMEDFRGARASFRRALELNRSSDYRYGIADNLSNIGIALFTEDRFEEAEPYLREGAELHEEVGARYKSAMVNSYLACTLHYLGETEEARRLMDQALETVAEESGHISRLEVLAQAFRLHMDSGSPDAAEQTLKGMQDYISSHDVSLESLQRHYEFTAQLAEAGGDVEALGESLRRSLEVQRKLARRQSAMFTSFLDMQQRAMGLKMEAKLARIQKYESLALLTAGIAHDFNNSLHVIAGNARRIQGGARPDEPVGRILDAVRSSAELCDQMLAFGGHASMNPAVVNPEAVISEVIPYIDSLESRVEVSWSPQGGIPPVRVDPVQLKNWVISLVTNSLEAIEEEGHVDVRTGFVPADSARPQGAVTVTVTDDGPGIPKARLSRIFDPFFTTKGTGKGMGLSVVRGGVQSAGGEIAAKSEPGVRTELSITLPCAAGTDGSDDGPEPACRGRSGLVVHLIDDEETVLEVTSAMLKAMGHNVLGYESGAEYLEALVDAPKPDCVVLDMTMPGMKGSQVFVRMRKMGCSAPVVLISGFSSRESMAHFHDELPSFFLQKPFGQEDLRLAVCRAIEAGGGDSG